MDGRPAEALCYQYGACGNLELDTLVILSDGGKVVMHQGIRCVGGPEVEQTFSKLVGTLQNEKAKTSKLLCATRQVPLLGQIFFPTEAVTKCWANMELF